MLLTNLVHGVCGTKRAERTAVPQLESMTRAQRLAFLMSEEEGCPPEPKPLFKREARKIIDDLYLMGEDPHIDLIRATAGRVGRERDPLRGLHHLWYID